LVLVTTEEQLHKAVRRVEDDEERVELTILVFSGIGQIWFQVSSNIHTLKILRCMTSQGTHDKLLIHGSSEFRGTRLDQWESRPHRSKLYIGEGVGIQLSSDAASTWFASTDNLTRVERDRIRGPLEKMCDTEMKGSWWKKWRGPMAVILGIVTTGTKLLFALKASAGGIYVKFQFGKLAFEVATAGAKLSVITTAAGPAVLLGVAVAASVYFIPWENVFTWLDSQLSSFWNWIASLYQRFKTWKNSQSTGSTSVANAEKIYRMMPH
jgi:hypothetical protein